MRFNNPGGASASIAAVTTISPESSTASAATNQAQSNYCIRSIIRDHPYRRKNFNLCALFALFGSWKVQNSSILNRLNVEIVKKMAPRCLVWVN